MAMQNIAILRLLWHSRNISFKVFRTATQAAEIAEIPLSFPELHSRHHWGA